MADSKFLGFETSPSKKRKLRVGGLDYNESNAFLRPGPTSVQSLDQWDRQSYINYFVDDMPGREVIHTPP